MKTYNKRLRRAELSQQTIDEFLEMHSDDKTLKSMYKALCELWSNGQLGEVIRENEHLIDNSEGCVKRKKEIDIAMNIGNRETKAIALMPIITDREISNDSAMISILDVFIKIQNSVITKFSKHFSNAKNMSEESYRNNIREERLSMVSEANLLSFDKDLYQQLDNLFYLNPNYEASNKIKSDLREVESLIARNLFRHAKKIKIASDTNDEIEFCDDTRIGAGNAFLNYIDNSGVTHEMFYDIIRDKLHKAKAKNLEKFFEDYVKDTRSIDSMECYLINLFEHCSEYSIVNMDYRCSDCLPEEFIEAIGLQRHRILRESSTTIRFASLMLRLFLQQKGLLSLDRFKKEVNQYSKTKRLNKLLESLKLGGASRNKISIVSQTLSILASFIYLPSQQAMLANLKLSDIALASKIAEIGSARRKGIVEILVQGNTCFGDVLPLLMHVENLKKEA